MSALFEVLLNAIVRGRCRRWQLQDAKSQFSEVVQRALAAPHFGNVPADMDRLAQEPGAAERRALLQVGPSGHVVQANNETLHWNGDAVLFTANASGAVDGVKVGAGADIWNNVGTWTVQFNQRDFSGSLGSPPVPIARSASHIGSPQSGSLVQTASRMVTTSSKACAITIRRWARGRRPTFIKARLAIP